MNIKSVKKNNNMWHKHNRIGIGSGRRLRRIVVIVFVYGERERTCLAGNRTPFSISICFGFFFQRLSFVDLSREGWQVRLKFSAGMINQIFRFFNFIFFIFSKSFCWIKPKTQVLLISNSIISIKSSPVIKIMISNPITYARDH